MHSAVADHLLYRKAVDQWAIEALEHFVECHKSGRKTLLWCAAYILYCLLLQLGGGYSTFVTACMLAAWCALMYVARTMEQRAHTALDLQAMRGVVARAKARREAAGG